MRSEDETKADPDLNAFVVTRIDKTAFETLTKQIATHVPSDRCVDKSAQHTWRKRQPHNIHKSVPK